MIPDQEHQAWEVFDKSEVGSHDWRELLGSFRDDFRVKRERISRGIREVCNGDDELLVGRRNNGEK